MSKTYTSQFSVGGDPEFFLVKDGIPTFAGDLVTGTKEEPQKLKHGAVQKDGLALEFNIDPAKSDEEFEHNINETIGEIRKMIPKEYKFLFHPSTSFTDSVLDKVPEIFKELGCSPDWNAFTGLQNPTPMNMLKLHPRLRSAGGHITLGWGEKLDKKDPSHIWDCEYIVKSIDPIYQSRKNHWDFDSLRSRLYGKPGAYRPTPFGVEYRSPSNAWVNYPCIYRYMFQLVTQPAECIAEGKPVKYPQFKKEFLSVTRND